MKTGTQGALLAALLALTAVGCGVPSSLDICHSLCDARKRCGVLSDAMAANCHTDCDNRKGSLADTDAMDDKNCKNAGDVRGQLNDCVNKECNKIDTCLATVDRTCVTK